jgi:hypothetical protein
LLRIKALENVELGRELTASRDSETLFMRFFKMKVLLSWNEARMPLTPRQAAKDDGDVALLLQALSANQAAHNMPH